MEEFAARHKVLSTLVSSPESLDSCIQMMNKMEFEALNGLVAFFGPETREALEEWKAVHAKLSHPTVVYWLAEMKPSDRPQLRRDVMTGKYDDYLVKTSTPQENQQQATLNEAILRNTVHTVPVVPDVTPATQTFAIVGSWGPVSNEKALENLKGKGRTNSEAIEKHYNCKLYINNFKGNSPARYQVKANTVDDYIGAMKKALSLLEINQNQLVTIVDDSAQLKVFRMREREFIELQKKHGVHIDRMPGKESIIYGWTLNDAQKCYEELKLNRSSTNAAAPAHRNAVTQRRVNFA